MSLCDTCCKPGHCCTQMVIGGMLLSPMQPMDNPNWKEDHKNLLERHGIDFAIPVGLRFYKNEDGRAFGNVLLTCKHLDANGRCSIYERRPSLCAQYEAKSDSLCAEFCGPPNIYPNGTS